MTLSRTLQLQQKCARHFIINTDFSNLILLSLYWLYFCVLDTFQMYKIHRIMKSAILFGFYKLKTHHLFSIVFIYLSFTLLLSVTAIWTYFCPSEWTYIKNAENLRLLVRIDFADFGLSMSISPRSFTYILHFNTFSKPFPVRIFGHRFYFSMLAIERCKKPNQAFSG